MVSFENKRDLPMVMQIQRQAQSKDLALKFLGPKDHIQSDLHAYQVSHPCPLHSNSSVVLCHLNAASMITN